MNVRNLIKLLSVELTAAEDRNYDNPYEHKLEILYGPVEAPYRDAIALTTAELSDLTESFNKVCEVLNAKNT